MTKKEAIQKIKEILVKNKIFIDSKIEVSFKNKTDSTTYQINKKRIKNR